MSLNTPKMSFEDDEERPRAYSVGFYGPDTIHGTRKVIYIHEEDHLEDGLSLQTMIGFVQKEFPEKPLAEIKISKGVGVIMIEGSVDRKESQRTVYMDGTSKEVDYI